MRLYLSYIQEAFLKVTSDLIFIAVFMFLKLGAYFLSVARDPDLVAHPVGRAA